MTDAEKRLKAQLDANTAEIRRMQMQANRREQYEDYDADDAGPYNPPAQGPHQDPYGNDVDPNALIMQAITTQATNQAVKQVNQQNFVASQRNEAIKARMVRLVKDYPALAEEGSELLQKARQIYARIATENPGLDESTRYELAAREAASIVGARPVTLPAEELTRDWTMGSGQNPALPSKATRSRLTPGIVGFASLMGINVDPKTKQGQINLRELSDYSGRFNADANEDHVKYR